MTYLLVWHHQTKLSFQISYEFYEFYLHVFFYPSSYTPPFHTHLSPTLNQSHVGLFSILFRLPSFLFSLRQWTSSAPVADFASAVIWGGEFHLPAKCSRPRGLHGSFHPAIRPWRGISVSSWSADVEGHSWTHQQTHFPIHCDRRL